jgi:hypothetical protein
LVAQLSVALGDQQLQLHFPGDAKVTSTKSGLTLREFNTLWMVAKSEKPPKGWLQLATPTKTWDV